VTAGRLRVFTAEGDTRIARRSDDDSDVAGPEHLRHPLNPKRLADLVVTTDRDNVAAARQLDRTDNLTCIVTVGKLHGNLIGPDRSGGVSDLDPNRHLVASDQLGASLVTAFLGRYLKSGQGIPGAARKLRTLVQGQVCIAHRGGTSADQNEHGNTNSDSHHFHSIVITGAAKARLMGGRLHPGQQPDGLQSGPHGPPIHEDDGNSDSQREESRQHPDEGGQRPNHVALVARHDPPRVRLKAQLSAATFPACTNDL
jgi:hypothetical protein